MFYRTDLRQGEDCLEPAFQPDTGWTSVVYGPDYAIIETSWLERDPPPEVERLPQDLERLLYSGQAYPPALALALDVCEHTDLEYRALCDRLRDELTKRLDAQATDGFRLLRAVVDESGYMTRGEYYWVLGYFGTKVFWVSYGDYQIYPNPCSDFGLEEADLPNMLPDPWSRRI